MDDITDEQIRDLQREAGAHGDREQVAICRLALEGDEDALEECARVIREWADVGEEVTSWS